MKNQQLATFGPVNGGVSAGAMAADVRWVGNTYHWPFNGNITPSSEVWINTESSPMGAAVGWESRLQYRSRRNLAFGQHEQERYHWR